MILLTSPFLPPDLFPTKRWLASASTIELIAVWLMMASVVERYFATCWRSPWGNGDMGRRRTCWSSLAPLMRRRRNGKRILSITLGLIVALSVLFCSPKFFQTKVISCVNVCILDERETHSDSRQAKCMERKTGLIKE